MRITLITVKTDTARIMPDAKADILPAIIIKVAKIE